MEGILDKMGPAIQTIAVYASYLISAVKKMLSLFRFATGVDIVPETSEG